ncbi:roadblock/LC7 domain-containing protein [Enterobacteriaceae bacterium ESL0689]|nr:roadblock/LC7 domain-containing protein [Enterobacteriaceae bacterium ESL0689]
MTSILPFAIDDTESIPVESNHDMTQQDTADIATEFGYDMTQQDAADIATEFSHNMTQQDVVDVTTEFSQNGVQQSNSTVLTESSQCEIQQNTIVTSTEMNQQIQQLLSEFAQNYPVMSELLVATSDGYEVAAVLKTEDSGRLRKIAAMTSSLLGIGSAILNEIDAGEQKAITVEGEKDNILLWQIATHHLPLCLTVIASTHEPLGQLFWLLRQLATSISEICNTQPEQQLS